MAGSEENNTERGKKAWLAAASACNEITFWKLDSHSPAKRRKWI